MLPLDIQADIVKRLPVKSLIQFRIVCKAWKSLIDSSDFIKHYSTQAQHLLRYADDSVVFEGYNVSIVDNLPEPRDTLTLHALVNMLKYPTIIGSSHGLFCLYGYFSPGHDFSFSGTNMFVLWNISLRKVVAVVEPYEPNVADGVRYATLLGFGVCRETTDPKIVMIKHIDRWRDMERSSISWQVEVFTLSTGAWRRPYSNNLPRKSIKLAGPQVVVDGSLYWRATDKAIIHAGLGYYNMIISFDMTNEEFREVSLPHSLAHQPCYNLSISKLKESLVVLEHDVVANSPIFGVWGMEDGVPNSFTKLFTFNCNTQHASVWRFGKTCEPIIESVEYDHGRQLVVYKPYLEHTNNRVTFTIFVYPYMETLLLLDQPVLTIYNKGKRCILQQREQKALEALIKQDINQ